MIFSHRREIKDFYKVTNHQRRSSYCGYHTDNHIILQKEYWHCYGEDLIEIPAGVLENGEDSLNAANIELEEETGYENEKWTFLGKTVERSLTTGTSIWMRIVKKSVTKSWTMGKI